MKKIEFGFHPAPKVTHKRFKPTRKQRGEFSKETIAAIELRDGKKCVKCGSSNLDCKPHHITYRSQLGEGSKRNGCCICLSCHEWVHNGQKGPNGEPSKEGRYWFEMWRDENLDENGDMIND